MAYNILLYLLVQVSFLHLGTAQLSNCTNFVSCSECISTTSCVWCSTPGSAHCLSQDNVTGCNEQDLFQPMSNITDQYDMPLNEKNQVSLETISLKLRVGEPLTFTVSVKAAEDFPLDLYMLMDLSGSFEGDLIVVKGLAPQLPLALRNVSSDFLIGFGTFVDKPSLPYTSSVQKNTIHNVSGQPSCDAKKLCAKPFDYEHIVSLTNSSDLFNSLVQETVISSNVDDPEDPLGAMLQAVVCKGLVGWRENSRKILLIMTDDVLHTAGDGRLAGIVKPNDGQCHTQYDPSYNKVVNNAALMQDYPSIEQVREVLQDNDIIPVFAISLSENALVIYNTTVGPSLGGFTTILTANSTNLVNVLEEAYLKVVSSARLSFNLPNYLSVNITANCPPEAIYLPDTYECAGIGNGTVTFTITLMLKKCTNNFKNGITEQVVFHIPGFGQFTVDIDGICSCDCDSETEYNSSTCSTNGDLTCGLCTCTNGWMENDCSCSTAQCPLGPNGAVCSGRGQCECGQCVCTQTITTVSGVHNPRIVGNACECSNYECDTGSNGLVCSGRGLCMCSNGQYTCKCNISPLTGETHTGDACQCSSDHCIDPNNIGRVCNGRGTCDSCQPQGRACICNDGYRGQYCETTTSMSLVAVCDNSGTVRECVKCYGEAAKDNKEISSICLGLICGNFTLLREEPSQGDYDVPGTVDSSTVDCSFIDGECRYNYYVGLSTNEESIYAVPPRACLLIPSWSIALIVLVFLVIIGCLVLVCIKCCIMYLDYREFKKFEKEVKEVDFSKSSNPLYHKPDVTYTNIAYGKE